MHYIFFSHMILYSIEVLLDNLWYSNHDEVIIKFGFFFITNLLICTYWLYGCINRKTKNIQLIGKMVDYKTDKEHTEKNSKQKIAMQLETCAC